MRSSTAIDRRWATSASRPAFERRAAKQRASFESRAILRQLEQRRAAPRTDDLHEAEAVDRGALERLGQRASIAAAAACAPPCRRRSAGRSRSSRRCRAGGSRWPLRAAPRTASSSGVQDSRRRRSGSSPASATIRSSPPANCDDPASRLLDQIVPARLARARPGRGRPDRAFAARGSGAPASSVSRASGRFHGSAPGIASRVTSMFERRAFASRRQRRAAADIRRRPLDRDGVAAAVRLQPGARGRFPPESLRRARSAPR